MDAGHAVPDIGLLLARIWAWEPSVLVADPYRSAELNQVAGGRVRIVERARGGGETTSNIQSLRSLLLDSDSGVTQESRALLGAAFEQTNLDDRQFRRYHGWQRWTKNDPVMMLAAALLLGRWRTGK